MQLNYTISDFRRDLRDGQHAWPGGYPRFFITSDGAALSFEAARDNVRLVLEALRDDLRDGWQVVECSINWEDPGLFCDHTGFQIVPAYEAERI